MPALQVNLQPYEFDEYLIWAFRRGLHGRFAESEWDAVVRSLESRAAKTDFAKGLLLGASAGARIRLNEEIDGTLELVQGAMNWTLEGYTTLFDPALLLRGLLAWGATPGTPEFKDSVADFGTELRIRHPALSAALDALAEAVPTLRALADWLQQPDAMRQVLGALAEDFGDLLGDFWGEVVSLTKKPQALGDKVGNDIGRLCAEIALFVLRL